MKRLSKKRGITKSIRFSVRFLKQNSLVFLLIVFMIIGAFIGTVMADLFDYPDGANLHFNIAQLDNPVNFINSCKAVCSSAFCFLLFLAILFLSGLTAFGYPLILLITMFYGFWVGISQAKMYIECGFLQMILFVHFPMILSGCAVVFAAKQSILMSCLFSRQLLPFSAHCGSLWHDFKRYLTVYLVCLGIVIAAATFQVVTKIWYPIL